MPRVLVGAVGLLACAVVALRDPNVEGSYGICPFLALTGYDCPGCGLLRGTHAALHGDLIDALDHNVLWPLVIPLIGLAYLRWAATGLGWEPPTLRVPTWVPVTASVGLLGFWFVRNLGGPFEVLASGAT